jgi:hypothetical protein
VCPAAVLGAESAALATAPGRADAGYAGRRGPAHPTGVVLYEIRVGPYDNLADAQRAGEAIRRSEGLTPALLIEPSVPEEE